MALIGIEEHWTTPGLTVALNGLPEQSRDESLALNEMGDNLERLEDLADGRIAAMDEQGVDMQIIALAPPGTGALSGSDALALSRTTNDIAAEAVRRHPTRLRAMATLPMTAPEAAAGELERAASLGLVGAMVYGRTGDVPLDDARYDELFSTAATLGHPIFIHPQIPSPTIRQAAYSGFDPMTELALSTFGWGWHIEAALAALRLMARGTLDRNPELQLILGHWGGAAALLGRSSRQPRARRRFGSDDHRVPPVERLHHELRNAQPGPAPPRLGGHDQRSAAVLNRLSLPAPRSS